MTLLNNNLRDTQSNLPVKTIDAQSDLPVKFEGAQSVGVTARKLYWGCDEDITGVLVM